MLKTGSSISILFKNRLNEIAWPSESLGLVKVKIQSTLEPNFNLCSGLF